MDRSIKLNSSKWCDIVFEGKNKKYGAYALRQSSSKRHLVAFGIVIIFVGIVAAIPAFMKAVNKADTFAVTVDGPFIIDHFPTELEKEEPIVDPIISTPPPVKIRATEMFTPPVVKPDAEVDEAKELKSQETLHDTRATIGTETIGDSFDPDAVDPGTLLRNEQITGTPTQIQEEKPVHHVEQMPQYPGGEMELMKYLSSNIKYPTMAAEQGIEGRVVLQFVVGKDGRISDVKVVRTLDPSCDREAVRVVNSMQKWIPGMQNGRNVPVYFTLPVLFKLQR